MPVRFLHSIKVCAKEKNEHYAFMKKQPGVYNVVQMFVSKFQRWISHPNMALQWTTMIKSLVNPACIVTLWFKKPRQSLGLPLKYFYKYSIRQLNTPWIATELKPTKNCFLSTHHLSLKLWFLVVSLLLLHHQSYHPLRCRPVFTLFLGLLLPPIPAFSGIGKARKFN
jgi:hypothetical protein